MLYKLRDGCGNTIEKYTERRRLLGKSDSSKRVATYCLEEHICMKVSNKSEELDRINHHAGMLFMLLPQRLVAKFSSNTI